MLKAFHCRQHIEIAMEDLSTEEKLQREAAVERRKQARTDIKRLQEQEIALLIARYLYRLLVLKRGHLLALLHGRAVDWSCRLMTTLHWLVIANKHARQ